MGITFNLKHAVLAALIQVLLQLFCWGFTVDDAWIVSRVASHGLEHGQFCFNLGQPSDAVTPLGFAHYVALLGFFLGKTDAQSLFEIARWSGLCAQLVSFFLAGGLVPRGVHVLWLLCASLSSVPSAVWAGAGLSGSLVGLFLVVAVGLMLRSRPLPASLLLGCAVAWRPELGLYALGVATFFLWGSVPRTTWLYAALYFALPIALVATLRMTWFGHILPLSVMAKAPTFEGGLFYATMTLIWGGLLPVALLASGLFRAPRLALPVIAHLLALLVCGGDWMPALRLSAPIYPSLIVLLLRSYALKGEPKALMHRIKGGVFMLAPIMPLYLLSVQGADFRAVVERRNQLVVEARTLLAQVRVVAGVDVGWLGLATSAQILDLGGVTDPRIGRLPGGHTDRMIGPGLFSDREVDAWVVRAWDRNYRLSDPPQMLIAAYRTDARLLRVADDLDMQAQLAIPLAGTTGQYVIFMRRNH